MSYYKNIILVGVFLAVFGLLFWMNAPTAKAVTVEELQAQVSTLLAQIASLQQQLVQLQGGLIPPPPTWCHNFNTNLRIEMSGTEVEALQAVLTSKKEGFTISQSEINAKYFGESTASAVVGFQEKYASEILFPLGLKRGTGYVGSATRAKLNQLYGCIQPKPSITVISPNGGEEWSRTTTQEIKWRSNIPTLPIYPPAKDTIITLETYVPHGSYMPVMKYIISSGTPNTGSYKWVVGKDEKGGDIPQGQYLIRIQIGNYSDTSDAPFSIVAAQTSLPDISISNVTFIPANPAVNEWITTNITVANNSSLDINTAFDVNVQGTTATVSSLLAWSKKTVTVSNAFSFSTPGTHTLHFPVDIWNTVKESNEDNNTFTTTLVVGTAQPSITVISPNGGESWERGSTYGITWTSSGIDFVNIWLVDYRSKTCPPCYLGRDCPTSEAARCGPVSKLIVSSILASVGKYSWTVPADVPSGSNYKIRIDNAIVSFPTLKLEADRLVPTTTITKYVADESNNYFSIVALFSTSNNILTASFDDCTGKVFYRDAQGNPVGCPPGYTQQGSIHVGKAVYPCDSDVIYGKDYFGNYLKSGWMPFCSKDDSTKLVVSYDDCGLVTPTKCPLGYSPKKSFHIGTSSKCTDKAYWAGGSYDNKAIKSGWITFCAKNDDALLIENCPTGYQEKGFIKDYFKHTPDLKYCIK